MCAFLSALVGSHLPGSHAFLLSACELAHENHQRDTLQAQRCCLRLDTRLQFQFQWALSLVDDAGRAPYAVRALGTWCVCSAFVGGILCFPAVSKALVKVTAVTGSTRKGRRNRKILQFVYLHSLQVEMLSLKTKIFHLSIHICPSKMKPKERVPPSKSK